MFYSDIGWKRETIIRGVTKNGGIKGDVTYVAPDSSNKFKQMSDITQVFVLIIVNNFFNCYFNSTWITKKALN